MESVVLRSLPERLAGRFDSGDATEVGREGVARAMHVQSRAHARCYVAAAQSESMAASM
jgi:hypothetical protein